jgi:hypothetical protein
MAAPTQANNAPPPPTADVDEVIQLLIKDGKRRIDEVLKQDCFNFEREKRSNEFSRPQPRPFPSQKKTGTFEKLRRRLLEELASDAEVSARADEAVAAEMERRARVGSAGGERSGSGGGNGIGNQNSTSSSAAAATAASFLAAPGARKEVVSRAAADAEDAVTAAALAAAWKLLWKEGGGGAGGGGVGAAAEARRQSPSLASEVEQATERALRRLWDARDGVATEGGGG